MSISREELCNAYLLGRNNNNELTPELLKSKGWSSEKILQIINTLVEKRLCTSSKVKTTGKIRVKVREESIVQNLRLLPPDDYTVYCAIEDSGNSGLWTQDICRSTGLQSHIVQKSIKNLCDQLKLIKQLKSIHQKNRKIYILCHLEPSKEVVGGHFYNNSEFNEDLVEKLRSQILHLLRNTTKATFTDIFNYISSCGITNNLNETDIRSIIRTLQLEKQIQISSNVNDPDAVYLCSRWPSQSVFKSTPCVSCPLANECCRFPGGKITPQNCKYFDYWLGYQDKL